MGQRRASRGALGRGPRERRRLRGGLWAVAQELDMPLSRHVGTYRWQPGIHLASPTQDLVEFANREGDVRRVIAALILCGVFERYPRLQVGAGPGSRRSIRA